MKLGRLALRGVVGGLFVGHGTQKLFGWFDGNGLEATAQGFDSMGLKPGKRNAMLAGASEALGGAGLALGYRTPLAAAMLSGTMLTAIKNVHAKNGIWSHKGGFEYNVVLLTAALAIVDDGPGAVSLDALRGKEHTGLLWTLFAAGLGAAGAAGVEQLAGKQQPPAEDGWTSAPAPPEPAQPPAAAAPVSVEEPAAAAGLGAETAAASGSASATTETAAGEAAESTASDADQEDTKPQADAD